MTESHDTDTPSGTAGEDPGTRTHPDARQRPRVAVGVGGILRTAARTGRRHAWRILAIASVVSLAIVAAEVIADNLVDPHNQAPSIGGTLSSEAISFFGTILLAGFLCKLVGEAEHAREAGSDPERTTIVVVLRTLPWISLVVADILVAVLTIAGLLLLVIPGLLAFTLFALVAPAIEIERRRPLSGLRRSAHLVRQRFWTVALLTTVPQLGLALAESLLPDPHGALHILEVIVIRVLVVAPFEAAVTLILVALCYRLMELDAPATAAG